MAYVNFQRSYVRFKIVYYGPGLCGKTTNLEHLHALSKGKVEMVSLETEGDRTIFFDYMPLHLGRLGGIDTVFKLYTVPGQVRYNRTRQMVLRDVDGVVFVADSQAQAMHDNLASLRNLEENLAQEGVDLSELPLVFQYNKRDLPEVLPVEELDAALNPGGRAFFPASALDGENVRETLTAIAQHVFLQAAERYGLAATRSIPAPGAEPGRHDGKPGAPGPAEDVATVPPPRLREDPGGAIEDPPLFAAPPTAPAASPVPPVPSPTTTLVDALAPLGTFERQVVSQLKELGEAMQQLAINQLDRDAFDEIGADLNRRIGLLGSEIERIRRVLESLSAVVLALHARQGPAAGGPEREVRRDMERLLEDYVREPGRAAAQPEPELGGAAARGPK